MRCVVQRVTEAAVRIDGELVGQAGKGFLLLIGVEVGDTAEDMDYIARKVPNLRIFEDEDGKMNRSLLDVGGDILAVSQFTLLGDARGGRRPSFITAARPEVADPMYEARAPLLTCRIRGAFSIFAPSVMPWMISILLTLKAPIAYPPS